MDILTFVTAGSVDDGKSTLIGRLLYDTHQIFEDQINTVQKAEKVEGEIDFSLFTDGLSDEREQKITIDVAYRYFSTETRRFIIADVPGHEQYTRNMVTGASKAKGALVLVDVRKGFMDQTKRHISLLNLLGISHIAIVINKMDMVNYDQMAFQNVISSTEKFLSHFSTSQITFIPASSLKGDMIVSEGSNMPWYEGPTILKFLEKIPVNEHTSSTVHFPIQHVIRPHQDFRGYMGTLISGRMQEGEELKLLPSQQFVHIKELFVAGKPSKTAHAGDPILVTLQENVDASRGDMFVSPLDSEISISQHIQASVAWFIDEPLETGKRYIIKHTTKTTIGFVQSVKGVLDMNSLQEKNGGSLKKNDIGKVIFQTQKPLFVDRYNQEKILGSFLIIDEISNATAGAGIITEKASNPNTSNSLNNFSSSSENLTLEQKVELSKIVLAYTFLQYPKIFATCSFGKDSRVLVDLILQLNKETKFYGIDTGYEFPESLQFAKELVEETHMNFSWIFAPEEERKKIEKEYGNEMIKNEQYKCCAMKRPALATITPKYQAWITGLRRDEALSRKNIPVIDTGGEIVKINPLAFWTKDDIWEYIHSKNLSYHPLYNEGYPSLGCAPCTQKPSDETKGNERAGRFVGTYEEGSECGLHK